MFYTLCKSTKRMRANIHILYIFLDNSDSFWKDDCHSFLNFYNFNENIFRNILS